MTTDPGIDEGGGPDNPCATCGHDGRTHVQREVEEAGRTVHETFCEGCNALCDFVPVTEA